MQSRCHHFRKCTRRFCLHHCPSSCEATWAFLFKSVLCMLASDYWCCLHSRSPIWQHRPESLLCMSCRQRLSPPLKTCACWSAHCRCRRAILKPSSTSWMRKTARYGVMTCVTWYTLHAHILSTIWHALCWDKCFTCATACVPFTYIVMTNVRQAVASFQPTYCPQGRLTHVDSELQEPLSEYVLC